MISQTSELDRHIGGDKQRKFGSQAVLGVLENAVTETVPSHIGVATGGRQGGGRPIATAILVAEINGLATGIGDRVVVPGSQAELVTVLRPSVDATTLGHDGAELWVGDHVDPRRGCGLPGREKGDVFPAIAAEATQAVEEGQIARR